MSMVDITPRDAVEKSGFLDRMPDVKLPKTPPTRVRRLVFWMVFCGFGLFGALMFWAATVQMTSAVISSGAFRVQGDRLTVQHLEGGIVRDINVAEGDVVSEGQILFELDDTRARAQLGIIENQLASALAQEARLRAELVRSESLEMSPELEMLISKDSRLDGLFEAQKAVFQSDNNMESGQIEIIKSRISQLNEQLDGQEKRRLAYVRQIEIVQEELSDLQQLLAQGLVPKTRVSNRMQAETQLMGDMARVESGRDSTIQRIGEMQERLLQVERDRIRRNSEERQRVQENIFDLRQRMDAIKDVLSRLTIRAPRSGRIVNLNVNTLGGVIEGGDPLLEIVPEDSGLILETRIAPSDIDEVQYGGKATVRLTAYSFRSTPPVNGVVSMVAADSVIDPATGISFYRVDITVPPEEISALPNVRALPGMPAQAMIETGRQTLVDYLIDPVLGRMSIALKEGSS